MSVADQALLANDETFVRRVFSDGQRRWLPLAEQAGSAYRPCEHCRLLAGSGFVGFPKYLQSFLDHIEADCRSHEQVEIPYAP